MYEREDCGLSPQKRGNIPIASIPIICQQFMCVVLIVSVTITLVGFTVKRHRGEPGHTWEEHR